MTTAMQWLRLYVPKILGFATLWNYFADPLQAEVRFVAKDLFGLGGTIGTTKIAFTTSGDTFSLNSATMLGYNGQGNRMFAALGLPEWASVPYENSGATVYHVGAKASVNVVPGDIEEDAAGNPQIGSYLELIGELVTPSSIVDNGNGTVTLVLPAAGGLGAWGTDPSPRNVIAWLVAPVTTGGEAIYTGTAQYDAADARIEVEPGHQFGQSGTPSTTPGDYRVFVKGPSITVGTTTDLTADPDYWFLGTITSGVFDDTAQRLITSLGDVSAAFNVQHNPTTGVHGAVTADSYGFNTNQENAIAIYTADDFKNAEATLETTSGTATLDHEPYDEGNSFPNVSVNNDVSATVKLRIPARLPGNVTITHFKILARMAAGGSVAVSCAIERAVVDDDVPTLIAARAKLATHAATDTTDAWVLTAKTAVTEYALTQTDADRLEIVLSMTNNGASNGSARFGTLVLYGKTTTVAEAGWATK